ncbi:hypothetical protein BDC45DRAFT_415104, partial [Circinella umbellata]
LPMFIFITDFCNNFNIPGPYNDIDKAIVIVYHLIIGISINQMETYLNYTNFFRMNIDIDESNFTFPINKKKKIKLQKDEEELNKYIGGFRSKIETYFAYIGKKFNRFDAKNKIRVTKLETYNIQLRFCCALLNIKKIVDITKLNMLPKYSKWMEKGFNYPNKNNII